LFLIFNSFQVDILNIIKSRPDWKVQEAITCYEFFMERLPLFHTVYEQSKEKEEMRLKLNEVRKRVIFYIEYCIGLKVIRRCIKI